MKPDLTIGFIGNPNSGKTTLFNAYTGANLKVANWPGVTVEKKEGAMRYHGKTYKLVDLPGTYSLTSYSMEEIVSRQYILSDEVDVLVNVADASALERNLYLTLQLIELGKPVILALNMMDIVERRGMEIDLHRLPEMLGIPVIPVSARKKTGMDILLHAAAHHGDHPIPHHHYHPAYEPAHQREHAAFHRYHRHPVGDPAGEYSQQAALPMLYCDEIENRIEKIMAALRLQYPRLKNYRWYAIKLLEGDEEIAKLCPVERALTEPGCETEIINQKYDFIEEVVAEVLVGKAKQEAVTDKADTLFTHRWLGLPIFLGIMALVFSLTFLVGDWLKGYFEMGLEYFSDGTAGLLEAARVAPALSSLVVDGIIAGVGGILTFLPNIFILFLALAFLEDSGYMARVAYVMDDIMGRLGLSGKAFIPMLLGFGCSVPAIMASRTLESKKDRRRVMLVTPFMSCSAKLPIYVLFAGMFFENHAALASFSMYLLGVFIAIATMYVIHVFDQDKTEHMLLIELPEYKAPGGRTIFIYVWEKVKDYLFRAGTVIFVSSIVMWVLLNFGPGGYVTEMSVSYGSMLGKVLVPVLRPIGLGYWQIAVALIAGITAKEVVVSSCAVLFGIPNLMSDTGMRSLVAVLGAAGFGALNAYSLMVFCLLYVPCLAALATIRRESDSWAWTGVVVLFQMAMAWGVSFLVFQIGSALL